VQIWEGNPRIEKGALWEKRIVIFTQRQAKERLRERQGDPSEGRALFWFAQKAGLGK